MKNLDETLYSAKVIMCIAFALISLSRIEAEESQPEQTIRNFFNNCLNIQIDNITYKPETNYYDIGMAFRIFFVNDKSYVLTVSEDGTTIYSYGETGRSDSEASLVEGKRHADAISETTAFASAVSILNYFGFSTQKSDYEVTFADYAYNTTPRVDDLWGAHWHIHKKLYLNGLRCHGRYVSVNISAASGAIESFDYEPIIPPENSLNVQVTYATAQQTVITWLATVPYLEGKSPTVDTNNTQGEIVVAPKWNALEEPGLWKEEIKTYYCWQIPCSFIEYGVIFQNAVWVNIETGEVIGVSL